MTLMLKNYILKERSDNEQVTLRWGTSSIAKRFVLKEEINGEYTEISGIDQTKREFIIKNLKNLINYKFEIYFYDKDNKEIKKENFTVMPRSGTEADYETDSNNFTEENANKLLKNDHYIDFYMTSTLKKIYFDKDKNGNTIIILPSYQSEESVFNYSSEEREWIEDTDTGDPFWTRTDKVLDYKGNLDILDCWTINDYGTNVRYLLYLADFVNIYKEKITDMVDITNAPDWFKTLMETRKTSS